MSDASSQLRIAIAQCNPLVGDIAGNANKIVDNSRAAFQQGANLVLFPELVLCGYPPEDLLFRPVFQAQVENYIGKIAKQVAQEMGDLCLVLGAPEYVKNKIYNAAYVIQGGEVLGIYRKHCLPNYGVFDERRYFSKGKKALVLELFGAQLGITICEDIWHKAPAKAAKAAGAELLLNLNASPFNEAKLAQRQAMVRKRVTQTGLPLVYCNLVGGQDELVFDGRSMVYNHKAECCHLAVGTAEALDIIDFEKAEGHWQPSLQPSLQADEPQQATQHQPQQNELGEIYDAIVLAVRDYVQKNNFPGVVLGLSGGIDSALVLAIAADALGAENVEAVLMPSRYTADMSNEDAVKEAEVLGVKWQTIAIESAVNVFDDLLAERFAGMSIDTTEENIQARIRGLLLMAISNKTGKMVLTTSNKSETAIGYATLYGDMAGGYGPLKDVFKTLVYALARYRNAVAGKEIIPQRVIDRPPSAELRPDQKDSDSLPPYDILDPILELSIEDDHSIEAIVELGYDEAVVRRIVGLVKRNEYKRQQASPGVKITQRAFGRDRRYPITSGYTPGQWAK